jgi:hypothetical protein
MALERGKLSNVVNVAAASTVGIVTVSSSKKVYVKSIVAHVAGLTTGTAQVYFVPNGGTSNDPNNRIFDVTVDGGTTSGTVLLEPSYPLVLDTTGDALFVGAKTANMNFLITGDKEA